jgi:hypothetical protein
VPSRPVAAVSCHLEQPLEDATWAQFEALQRRRPGGFDVIALVRPPDASHGEDEVVWLERAQAAAARGPLGLHTHWTSPTHARPTGADPAARVRADAQWMRARGLEPRFFCGGGWYSDEAVRSVVAELGLIDCTPRGGVPSAATLPTTHSLGALARGVLGPLPRYVHGYFHDYDLLDPFRRAALVASLTVLARRRPPGDPQELVSEACAR